MRKTLASAFVLALIAVSLVSHNTNATSQDQPGVIRTSIQVTARTLNFYRSNSKMWSWVPEFKFSLTRARNSGDQHYVEYTIPGAGPALKFDCELNQRGDGFECGGRAIPEDKSATYTGLVNFAIKVRNELQGTDATLFTGKMKIAKACTNPTCPATAGEWVYFVDHDWNLPIGYIYFTENSVYGWDYPSFNVAFWLRGNTNRTEPHLFYQGKEVGLVIQDGVQVGKGICRPAVENEPTHRPHEMIGGAKWTRVECELPMIKRWDKAAQDQSDVFKMAANPGVYEFKLLWNDKLARSIKFTVGPDAKIDNGIATANKLGTSRVIVPVTIIGDQDGQWDRAAWKTEAFYGNPLTGFTAP